MIPWVDWDLVLSVQMTVIIKYTGRGDNSSYLDDHKRNLLVIQLIATCLVIKIVGYEKLLNLTLFYPQLNRTHMCHRGGEGELIRFLLFGAPMENY